MTLETMSSDAECTREGWQEYYAHTPNGFELHVSVGPDAELDGSVIAFDHDEQEMIEIRGWAVNWESIQ